MDLEFRICFATITCAVAVGAASCALALELDDFVGAGGASSGGAGGLGGTAGQGGGTGGTGGTGGSGASTPDICGTGGAPIRWANQYGDGELDNGTAVAVDSSDNVVVAGHVAATVTFCGSNHGSPPGTTTAFVAVIAEDGNLCHWSKSFEGQGGQGAGPVGDSYVNAIAVDQSDNAVALVGSATGPMDFGGGPETYSGQTHDMFVAVYTGSGTYRWSTMEGGPGIQKATDVAIMPFDSSVVVLGEFEQTLSFDDGLETSAGGTDLFLAKYGESGLLAWHQAYGNADGQGAGAVAVNSHEEIFVVGRFEGQLTMGSHTVLSAGEMDVLVAKLDATGTVTWAESFGDTASQVATHVAVDSQNAIVVAGHFESTVDFGGPELVSAGDDDVFVTKLNAAGVPQWSRRIGGPGTQWVDGLAVDPVTDDIVVAGRFDETIDYGDTILTSLGSADVFLAKLGPDGGCQWIRHLGAPNTQRPRDVVIDDQREIVMVGEFQGTFNPGTEDLTSAGVTDIFLAKFGP